MATVTYGNGKVVNFNGTPSQQDIEDVANSFGNGTPATPVSPSINIGGNMDSSTAAVDTGAPNQMAALGSGIQTLLPNQDIGKIGGTILGGIQTAITNPKALPYYNWNPHASVAGVAGDVAGDAINLAMLGGGEALTPVIGEGRAAVPSVMSKLAPDLSAMAGRIFDPISEALDTNLLSKTVASSGAAGGLSLSNTLAHGGSLADPTTWNNAAGSATLGAAFPIAGEVMGALGIYGKNLSGITPQMAEALSNSTPEEIAQYEEAARQRNLSTSAAPPDAIANRQVTTAAQKVTDINSTAGEMKGVLLSELGGRPIISNPQTGNPMMDDVLSQFNQSVEKRFGYTITPPTDPAGTIMIDGKPSPVGGGTAEGETTLTPMPGRGSYLSDADQNRILRMHDQIIATANNPTLQMASDTLHGINNTIKWGDGSFLTGNANDPLQGLAKETSGNINTAIRQTSPELADVNDLFSKTRNIQQALGGAAGDNLQHSTLLMHRVFSGDQFDNVNPLMKDIKDMTGIDLQKHAGLAKYATDIIGDDTSRTRLDQIIRGSTQAASGSTRGVVARTLQGGLRALLSPGAEEFAGQLSKGSSYATDANLANPFNKDFLSGGPTSANPFNKDWHPFHIPKVMADRLLNTPAISNLASTYANMLAAAHPEVGQAIINTANNVRKHLTP